MKRAQWALLNGLHGRLFHSVYPGSAADWAKQVDAELADLLTLEDADLIKARHPSWVRASTGPETLPRSGPPPDDLDLWITPKGMTWLDNDPHNKVLWAACAHRAPTELGRTVRENDLDLGAVADCCNAGLVVTVWMATDHPVASPVSASLLRDLVRDSNSDLRAVGLAATPSGRAIHGGGAR